MSNFLENKISLDQYVDQFWEVESQSLQNVRLVRMFLGIRTINSKNENPTAKLGNNILKRLQLI